MDSWLIGSAPESDIVVDQPMVSSSHCRLTKSSDGFLLEDLGSTNGTFLNGEKITGIRRVSPTDSITLGTKATLPWPAEATEAAAAPAPSMPTPGIPAAQKYTIPVVAGIALLTLGGVYLMTRPPAPPASKEQVQESGEIEKKTPKEQRPSNPKQPPVENERPPDPVPDESLAPKIGFQMGTFEPNDPIESIKVTIFVGEDGEDLEEPLDLHLGLGFPLRLYPVGSEERDPAFAAFPQKSEIASGETSVLGGTNRWFYFSVNLPDKGLDVLRATPPLLTDLRYADIQRIGFACRGESAWVLEGYKIEINGKLFASHDSVNRTVLDQQAENQEELKQLLTQAEPLALQVVQGQAYEAARLAEDVDTANLAQAKRQLADLEDPINLLRGQSEGIYPWYVEKDEGFKPSKPPGASIQTVEVKLLSGGSDRSGSANPIYLKARGRKYLLASAIDPLESDPELQEFTIPRDALHFDPITRDDLKPSEIGIGMLGHDDPFDRIPDRAHVQRVILQVDGEEVYDSQKNAQDRSTLAAISLIPPVHRDNVGFPVENPTSAYEVYLWKTGMPLPEEKKKELPPERDDEDEEDDDQDTDENGPPKPPKKGQDDDDDKKKKKGPSQRPKKKKQGPFNSRRRPPFPLIVINFPTIVLGGGVPNTPGPTKPVISNVRIDTRGNPIQFGRACRVTWRVKGNTSRVSRFRVRLYPVLPHRAGTILQPVAKQLSTGSGSRRATLTPSQALLAATSVSPSEHPVLYVQPEVTALSASGRVLNGTADRGPILPIFPQTGTPRRLQRGSPGLADPDWTALSSPPGQTFLAPARLATLWRFAEKTGPAWSFAARPITSADTGSGPHARTAVWWLNAQKVSQGSKLDSYPHHADGRWAHNSAMRPKHASSDVAMQFFRQNIPAPSRVVAHLGFINGGTAPGWNNSAQVDVEVRVTQPGTWSVLRWVKTNARIVCAKAPNTMTLIDIPVASTAAPPAGQHAIGSQLAPESAIAPATPITYVYDATAAHVYGPLPVATRSDVHVTVTTSLQHVWNSTSGQRQALGVFGLRLIP